MSGRLADRKLSLWVSDPAKEWLLAKAMWLKENEPVVYAMGDTGIFCDMKLINALLVGGTIIIVLGALDDDEMRMRADGRYLAVGASDGFGGIIAIRGAPAGEQPRRRALNALFPRRQLGEQTERRDERELRRAGIGGELTESGASARRHRIRCARPPPPEG